VVETLNQALALLPKRSARIVVLHDVRGLSFRRIAKLFRVTYQRIQQVHERAIARLRQLLAEQRPGTCTPAVGTDC
jgi:RNA polymerase sigma factor (sigma-70 family)